MRQGEATPSRGRGQIHVCGQFRGRVQLSPKGASPPRGKYRGDADEFNIQCINLPIIAVYFVAEIPSLGWLPAFKWLLACLALAVIDILVLLALSATNQWPSCNSHDDCSIGTVCAHVGAKALTTGRPPRCFDCYYLMDEGMPGSNTNAPPWTHFLVGQPGVNASGICEAVRTAPENLRFFLDGSHSKYNYEMPWLRTGGEDPRTFRNCLLALEKCVAAWITCTPFAAPPVTNRHVSVLWMSWR